MILRQLLTILVIACVVLVAQPLVPVTQDTGIVRADDDGDDGDDGGDDRDDDDDDDDDGRTSGSRDRGSDPIGRFLDRTFGRNDDARRQIQRRSAPSRSAVPKSVPKPGPKPAPKPVPRPLAAPAEIVTLALGDPDLAALQAQGYALIESYDIATLGQTARRLSIPAGTTLGDARAAIRELATGADADFNHFYRAEQGFSTDCSDLDCPARVAFGWPLPEGRDAGCGRGISIGMVDTGINPDHETFAGADLTVETLSEEDLTPSKDLHGTAIAALLVGAPDTRSPGLVPGASVMAIDAFHRDSGDERADVFTLVKALDRLADQGVEVINLSLAGPANTALERIVAQLSGPSDIVLLAATGNAGPRTDPLYPAAYDGVVAVTAVDRDRAIYRRAVQGDHVDVAAPGVAVWTAASIRGARWKTGTSFAVPFATAAAAALRQAHPDMTAAEVRQALRDTARDLGDPGHDKVFGAGLLNVPAACRNAVDERPQVFPTPLTD